MTWFVKLLKRLIQPLLPIFTVFAVLLAEKLGVSTVFADALGISLTDARLRDLDKAIAACALAAVIGLADWFAWMWSAWKGLEIKVGFKPARDKRLATDDLIGRMEDPATIELLVVEATVLKPKTRALLQQWLPDLELRVSWLSSWLTVADDEHLPQVESSADTYIAIPVWRILDPERTEWEKLLWLGVQHHRSQRGQLSPSLHSSHWFRLALARWLLLRSELNPTTLRLKAPAASEHSSRMMAGG